MLPCLISSNIPNASASFALCKMAFVVIEIRKNLELLIFTLNLLFNSLLGGFIRP